MHDTGLVNTELNLTCFGIFNSRCHVSSDGANLWVGHQTTWAQHLTQGTHHTHRVWRGNHHVKVNLASLDLCGQIVHTDDVSASGSGFISFYTLGKHRDALDFAGAVWQHNSATNHLVRLFGVNTELDSYVNGFIELSSCKLFDQA